MADRDFKTRSAKRAALINMMVPSPRPQGKELLNNIALRLRDTDGEESLYEDWKRLVRWLQSELRNLSLALRNWAKPWVAIAAEHASVNIEPNASWTFGGQSAVCLTFPFLLRVFLTTICRSG